MLSRVFLLTSAALGALAGPMQVRDTSFLPPRYHNSTAGATFLFSTENGGTSTPPTEYQTVYIQADQGHLKFTQDPPTRICPCSDSFGAQNFTGFYIGGSSAKPTVQLFTSNPLPQYVYIAQDLSLRYTYPGQPIPAGANSTSITTFNPEALGGNLPSSGFAVAAGHVKHNNGTKTYYNGLEFCAPLDSPSRTEDGVGPLSIRAAKTKDNKPGGSQVIDDRCISGTIAYSINDPKVGPYDIAFNVPSEPLVFAYY